MSILLIKPKEIVCRDRAQADADAKFDGLIKAKRDEFAISRRPKPMQDAIKLSREKGRFFTKAFEHHMDNYVHAADSISDKVIDKKAYGFKDFSDYLTEELNKI